MLTQAIIERNQTLY